MCITFLWVNPDFMKQKGDQNWQLVLINNRDECYTRPTSPATWKDGVLCGRDQEAGKEGGTWLAVNERGNLAFIHNMNYPPPKNPDELQGRGHIVEDYVAQNANKKDSASVPPLTYAQELLKSAYRYNGFSVTLIDRCLAAKNGINNNVSLNKSSNSDSTTPRWRIVTCSNRTDTGVELLEPGFHGFGNSPINKPFKRVKHGLQNFKRTCQEWSAHKNVDQFVDGLLKVLTDKEQCYPDDVLAMYQPNLAKDMLKYMSSCFVEFPPQFKYGTRTHTIILVDGQDHVIYVEKTLDDHVTKKWTTKKHEFDLKTG